MTHNITPLKDLTRWNRTGLSRFDYVDGDAAIWLEELRIAMLGLYLRGGDDETRLPEYWRDIYLRAVDDWPDVAGAADRVVWKRLAPTVPPQQETRGRRNERLNKQYGQRTDDYAWEVNRAFARASHTLLGYLNAYANEGYLRTATQWDNLRRLSAMVNYQPTPPASATATVGLLLKEDVGAVEVTEGLAMKHTPPEGGVPLIFETLETVQAHPALNAARAENWNENHTNIGISGGGNSEWHLGKDETLATGDIAVLADGHKAEAVIFASVAHDTDAEMVDVTFDSVPKNSYRHFQSRLWVGPSDIRTGLKVSKNRQIVIDAEDVGAVIAGDLIEVFFDNKSHVVEVLAAQGAELVLNMTLPDEDELTVRAMQPFALDDQGGVERVTGSTHRMWAPMTDGVANTTGSGVPSEETEVEGLRRFEFSDAKSDRAFSKDVDSEAIAGRIRHRAPWIMPGKGGKKGDDGRMKATVGDGRVVTFPGKPPKGLADGAWYVARNLATRNNQPLFVTGLRIGSGEFYVEFNTAPDGAHDRTEFHGPMMQSLRARWYARNPNTAFVGSKIRLENIPQEARELIKPGRRVLIRQQSDGTDHTVSAQVEEAVSLPGNRLELSLLEYEDARSWPRGEVSFALNTVQVSHGEAKGSKLLGSGDGERSAQMFAFAVKNVSHIPSTAAEAGVVPDMVITIEGERWEYADFIDPAAEGTKSWSTTLSDNGTLRIHFRRRLVTGQNNIVVTRHRVGAGAAGSGIPPHSFEKPMKKHRYVAEILQPFATAGGADREPVSKLRQSTPQRLSANGRAVSLSDFEHLATRNAAILRAHAELIPTSGSQKIVALTVALAAGGSVKGMEGDLAPAITARALPGVGVSFTDYEHLALEMAVTARSDLSVHNRTDIKAAAETRLKDVFSLENRNFGQTAYVSEILAALETVPGIENATVTSFGLKQVNSVGADTPRPRSVAMNDGKVAAIFAKANQIAHVAVNAASAVTVEVKDSQ